MAIAGLILTALLLVLDGPGGRWIIKSVLLNRLEKQGLHGDFEIYGYLHSGYLLKNTSFTGSGLIRSVEVGEFSLDYLLFKLLDKEIEGLSGRDIRIVLHPEPKQKVAKDETARLEVEIPEETIRTIRKFVAPMAIDFRNVALEIRRDDKPPLTVQLAGLSHLAGAESFRLTGLASDVLGDRGLPSQDIELGWTNDELVLSRFVVLPNISLTGLRLELPAGGPDKIIARLVLAGAELDLEADESGSGKLTLADKALNLQDFINELPFELDLAGTLETLTLEVDDLLAPPGKWRGHLELLATGLHYERFEIKSLAAKGRITPDGIELHTVLGPGGDTELTINTPLPDGEGKELLANHAIDLNLELHAIDRSLAPILGGFNKDPSKAPPVLPTGTCSISGRLILGEDGKLSRAAVNWHAEALTYDGKAIPPLKGSAKLAGTLAEAEITLAQPGEGEAVTLTAKADLDAKTYEAGAGIHLPDPAWVKAFIPGDSPLWKPSGPIAIDWKGSGSYKEMTHKGSGTIGELKLTAPNETLTSITSSLTYDWPGTLTLDSLLVRNGDLNVSGGLTWKDGVITIPLIETADETGTLMKLSGKAPLAESLRSLEDFLDQEEEFDLSFEADEFALARLRNLVPIKIPEGYGARFESKLRLAGPAAHPRIDGHLQILQARVPEPANLPPVTAQLEFSTSNDILSARGTVKEAGGEILKLDADLPLKIRDWASDPASIKMADFKAHAVSENFDFARVAKFVPQLAGVKGHLGVDVTAEGPAADPKLTGNIAASIDYLPLRDTPFRKVENSKLLARFEGRRIILDPSPIHVAGGKAILMGEANLEGEEPEFTLNFDADHALLWRNDSLLARANAKLILAGTPSKAKISGSIDIVESLFYKDIEIIPIGAPPTAAPKPSLPKIDKAATGGPLVPAPAPFADWGLEVKVRTSDPVLIRGNLATGSITIDAAVGGTISNPRPSGLIRINDLKAALPFSTLKIDKGSLVLRPDAPLDPTLDIQGTSSINNRQISMLLFGPLSKPDYTLSSNPPLPENEILTLVATGATTADLEDTNTASMKAFQLMIEELRRRSSQPGSNALFKRFMRDFGEVDLRVAENDPFSGRKFSSATLELSDKYYLSAGFDAEGNTRASIIYSLRFR